MLSEAAKHKSKDESYSRELEQQYKLLFSKIGRDFITRDELEFILRELLQELNVAYTVISALELAVEKARHYKELYEDDELGYYQDLTDLSEI